MPTEWCIKQGSGGFFFFKGKLKIAHNTFLAISEPRAFDGLWQPSVPQLEIEKPHKLFLHQKAGFSFGGAQRVGPCLLRKRTGRSGVFPYGVFQKWEYRVGPYLQTVFYELLRKTVECASWDHQGEIQRMCSIFSACLYASWKALLGLFP